MDFFDFQIEREDALGFGVFTGGHGVWALLCAALVAGLCLVYKRSGGKGRKALRLGTAFAAAGLELLRALLLMAAGQYGLGRLPLHLCTMAAYLVLLHALRGGRLIGQFLYAFCMPGALAAIFMPDWSYYPLFHFMTLCGFALHALIAAYVLTQLSGGDLRPDPKILPACLGLMLALALPVWIFDRLTGTNYMFLNWPPEGTPLMWFAALGRPGFLLGYLPLIACVWTVLYLPVWQRR